MSLFSSFSYSSWWNTWWTFLCRSLGFRPGQSGRLLVLGLDNAGKTTLLYTLAQQGSSGSDSEDSGKSNNHHNKDTNSTTTMGSQRAFPPTDRPALSNTFVVPTGVGGSATSSIQFTAWDLGGHEAVRHLWQEYATDGMIAAIVFVVDAADSERLEEAQYELDALIHDNITAAATASNGNGADAEGNSGGNGLPIAILLNKCDLEAALSTEEIVARLELDALQKQTHCQLNVFRISVWQRYGYTEALRWIASQLP
jgi:GTPase SAR1 family protein